jgi:hypothetical protein
MGPLTRRRMLLTGLGAVSLGTGAAPDPAASWTVRVVPADEPTRQLHADGAFGLLGTGDSGRLWSLSLTGQAPRRIAEGLDTATPIATGYGRIAARAARGGLWVWDGGRAHNFPAAGLAVHAGLLVLPLAVLAVVTDRTSAGHRLVRFEPADAGPWREVARSLDALLPDARPVQVDLDGRGDGGHIAVLAGPDATRYDHGVLGDGIEATRMLWLERHELVVMRTMSLPAPHVFEDIAPRPVLLPGVSGAPGLAGLLTVRSGPEGGQLALVTADAVRPQGLHLAALGETVGGFHRWLAPTTDGHQLAAVHTPHVGGVLHAYTHEGQQLRRRRVAGDVSTHHIGARETDLAVWLQGLLILPNQDGTRLRVFNPARDWAEQGAVELPTLPGRIKLMVGLAGPADVPALAVLLDDGRVVVATASAALPSKRVS